MIPGREIKSKPSPRGVDLTKGISIPKLIDADKEVLKAGKNGQREELKKNGNSGAT